jgi:hypothetical protein
MSSGNTPSTNGNKAEKSGPSEPGAPLGDPRGAPNENSNLNGSFDFDAGLGFNVGFAGFPLEADSVLGVGSDFSADLFGSLASFLTFLLPVSNCDQIKIIESVFKW